MNTHATFLQGIAILIQCVIVAMSTISDSWDAALNLSKLYLLAHIIGFIAVILDNRRGGISYLIEFFLLFFIALPAVIQVSQNVFPWFAMLQPVHICGAFGILALSHLTFHVGLIVTGARKKSDIQSTTQQLLSPQSALFYTRWAWAVIILAIFLAGLAGPSNLFVARFEFSKTEMGGLTEQFLYMSRSLSLLGMVMLLFLIKYTPIVRIKRANIYVLLAFLPLFLVINYLPALPRFFLFGIFIAISTIVINYFNPKIKSLVAIASVFILFIVFPAIKSLGEGELDTSAFQQRVSSGTFADYMLRVDFDAFMQVTETVHYYSDDRGPLLYGKNFLGVALFFIPRAIWPDKPLSTGIFVAERLGYEYLNVSSPLPAEALMAFGLIGPILVFWLLAAYVINIEYNAKPYKNSIPVPHAFVLNAISMAFIVIVLRGALNAVAAQFATAFLIFFIILFFKNRRVKFRIK
ncbi:hypothetical protein [Aestuariibacter sp. A3R04]|uniref:hypothetical protein n=1 Tax=Aestuariibacter sp. A3R04 TaxID=2841571 RepID=UPI001C0A3D63|nr:hypothetical protein [Aestuariibacter sp. A3R04]MBU3023752.1 hypothetical protein [Aestuariibacter sp. A3R04]